MRSCLTPCRPSSQTVAQKRELAHYRAGWLDENEAFRPQPFLAHGVYSGVMAARTLSLYTFLFAIALALGACKKDDFANETIAELQALADDIVKTVSEADDKKAGVAEAQKKLDAKKGELAPKMKEIMELRGFQVSEETVNKVNSGRMDAGMKVAKLALMTGGDPEVDKAIETLTNDFTSLVDGE